MSQPDTNRTTIVPRIFLPFDSETEFAHENDAFGRYDRRVKFYEVDSVHVLSTPQAIPSYNLQTREHSVSAKANSDMLSEMSNYPPLYLYLVCIDVAVG
jgi:hypothetical protein